MAGTLTSGHPADPVIAATGIPAGPPARDAGLMRRLSEIVGAPHLLTGDSATQRFRTGFRFGGGPVEAVVRPGTLLEQWDVLQACIAAGRIVIMQSANTGLTGGSTPDGADYDRPVIVINTMRIGGLHLLDGGRQVLAMPGATLFELEKTLRGVGREPHSVIGSSCFGASIFGGISNNSGGSLIQRGPAYTELALFAQVNAEGQLELVNHLGIELGDDPRGMLARLDRGEFNPSDMMQDTQRAASDRGYAMHVRDVEAPTPARFNADPRRLYEASGAAGKVAVFALRLDTFPADAGTVTFYIGTNDTAVLTALRRHILAEFSALPVAGEYMHRDAFDIAEVYGKDMFLAIRHLGTDRLPKLFAAKSWFDSLAARASWLPSHLSDRMMQWASRLFPSHLPARMKAYRDRFEHHLILKMGGEGIEEARQYLARLFAGSNCAFFECSAEEASLAFLHRFAAAGAAIRYRSVHQEAVEDIVALDIALRRNDEDWFETLPAEIEAPILHKLYYGHFFCHVFHQDYIVRKGTDCHALEAKMLALLDERGAEYPAEHNVGHLYAAKPALAAHYRALDPCNCFNPGIGKTTKLSCWGVSSPGLP